MIFSKVFEQFRKAILQAKLLMAEGKLQWDGEVRHVIVSTCHNFSKLLRGLASPPKENANPLPLNFPDEEAHKTNITSPAAGNEMVFPKGRNFH